MAITNDKSAQDKSNVYSSASGYPDGQDNFYEHLYYIDGVRGFLSAIIAHKKGHRCALFFNSDKINTLIFQPLFVHKRLFEQAGVKPPKSYSTFSLYHNQLIEIPTILQSPDYKQLMAMLNDIEDIMHMTFKKLGPLLDGKSHAERGVAVVLEVAQYLKDKPEVQKIAARFLNKSFNEARINAPFKNVLLQLQNKKSSDKQTALLSLILLKFIDDNYVTIAGDAKPLFHKMAQAAADAGIPLYDLAAEESVRLINSNDGYSTLRTGTTEFHFNEFYTDCEWGHFLEEFIALEEQPSHFAMKKEHRHDRSKNILCRFSVDEIPGLLRGKDLIALPFTNFDEENKAFHQVLENGWCETPSILLMPTYEDDEDPGVYALAYPYDSQTLTGDEWMTLRYEIKNKIEKRIKRDLPELDLKHNEAWLYNPIETSELLKIKPAFTSHPLFDFNEFFGLHIAGQWGKTEKQIAFGENLYFI